jgi:hypothetical protein
LASSLFAGVSIVFVIPAQAGIQNAAISLKMSYKELHQRLLAHNQKAFAGNLKFREGFVIGF